MSASDGHAASVHAPGESQLQNVELNPPGTDEHEASEDAPAVPSGTSGHDAPVDANEAPGVESIPAQTIGGSGTLRSHLWQFPCQMCGSQCEMDRLRVASKIAGTYNCKRRLSKYNMLQRSLGGAPPRCGATLAQNRSRSFGNQVETQPVICSLN